MTKRVYSINTPYYYEYRKQDGSNTPHALRREGRFTDNDYYTYRTGYIRRKSSFRNANGQTVLGGIEYASNTYYWCIVSALVWPNEADVIAKLAGKWRQTDLNIGMYLSPEGRESAAMVGNSLLKLANAARQLKRGDFGGFCRNLNELPRSARRASARKFNQGDLSGAFLAAHLGWEPLIKDIYTVSDNIKPLSDATRITARKLGPARNFDISGGSRRPSVDVRRVTTSQKTQVRLILDVKHNPTFAQRFGLDNPFLVAWELVPLSFVADYFLPIGNTIDSLGFISATWGSTGWRKTYCRIDYNTWVPPGSICGFTDSWGNFPYFNKFEIGETYYEWEATRTKWKPNFSAPFRSTDVKLPSSLMRLSTLAALAHQRILSLGKPTKRY